MCRVTGERPWGHCRGQNAGKREQPQFSEEETDSWKGSCGENDLVAVHRLDQKSQRKQEENDMGTWQQKGREGDTKRTNPNQHSGTEIIPALRRQTEGLLQVPG